MDVLSVKIHFYINQSDKHLDLVKEHVILVFIKVIHNVLDVLLNAHSNIYNIFIIYFRCTNVNNCTSCSSGFYYDPYTFTCKTNCSST
jgi:hypothetical protein